MYLYTCSEHKSSFQLIQFSSWMDAHRSFTLCVNFFGKIPRFAVASLYIRHRRREVDLDISVMAWPWTVYLSDLLNMIRYFYILICSFYPISTMHLYLSEILDLSKTSTKIINVDTVLETINSSDIYQTSRVWTRCREFWIIISLLS